MMQAVVACAAYSAHPEALSRTQAKGAPGAGEIPRFRQVKRLGNRKFPWAFLLVNGFFPFVLGFAIYTLWRSTKLLMFLAYRKVGLYAPILALRSRFAGFRHLIPGPILYSVPDALWVYAATAMLGYLWLDHPRRWARWFWTLLPVAIGVGSEFGQLFKLIPGTFDWMDVSCYLAAGALAMVSIHLFIGSGAGWMGIRGEISEP